MRDRQQIVADRPRSCKHQTRRRGLGVFRCGVHSELEARGWCILLMSIRAWCDARFWSGRWLVSRYLVQSRTGCVAALSGYGFSAIATRSCRGSGHALARRRPQAILELGFCFLIELLHLTLSIVVKRGRISCVCATMRVKDGVQDDESRRPVSKYGAGRMAASSLSRTFSGEFQGYRESVNRQGATRCRIIWLGTPNSTYGMRSTSSSVNSGYRPLVLQAGQEGSP